MKNILVARDLRKTYGENEAVKGVSFEIKAGEIFSLLGPNGAGKTTT
ncbi:MAG TPA: ATP-binding cassette domain-containing protein, partial [Anaerolineales bacterium]|nr:ATP-binding cassette domain-containing protein [Anaerolineales bacterium]